MDSKDMLVNAMHDCSTVDPLIRKYFCFWVYIQRIALDVVDQGSEAAGVAN